MSMKKLVILALAGFGMSANSFGMNYLRKGFGSMLAMAKKHPKKATVLVATAGVTGWANWPEKERPDKWRTYIMQPTEASSFERCRMHESGMHCVTSGISVQKEMYQRKPIMHVLSKELRVLAGTLEAAVCGVPWKKTKDRLHEMVQNVSKLQTALPQETFPLGYHSLDMNFKIGLNNSPYLGNLKFDTATGKTLVDINIGKCVRKTGLNNTETLSCATSDNRTIFQLWHVASMRPESEEERWERVDKHREIYRIDQFPSTRK